MGAEAGVRGESPPVGVVVMGMREVQHQGAVDGDQHHEHSHSPPMRLRHHRHAQQAPHRRLRLTAAVA